MFALTSATAPAYACTTIDTVAAAADGELGQVQPDQGNGHVQVGDKVTYPVCPPASGKHVNKVGFGPLKPQVYGPDDQSLPNGWVHNLEHGGLVLLYSCDKGACDDAGIAALQDLRRPPSPTARSATSRRAPSGPSWPGSSRCPRSTRRWSGTASLYLDTLDAAEVYDFYLRYGERVSDGRFVAPPEPQCAVPSASPPAGGSAEPSPAAS